MNLSKAESIINTKDSYRVCFYTRTSIDDPREQRSWYTRGKADYFPADNEQPFFELENAETMAKSFAIATKGEYYDIHVFNLRTKQQVGQLLNPINSYKD